MAATAQTRALYNALNNSGNVVIRRYPRTSDLAALAPVAVTSGKLYAYGAWAELVATNGITVVYWLVGGVFTTLIVNCEHEFQIGTGLAGSEVMRAELEVVVAQTTAAGEVLEQSIYLPLPLKCAANVRLACRSTGSANANQATNVAALVAINVGS